MARPWTRRIAHCWILIKTEQCQIINCRSRHEILDACKISHAKCITMNKTLIQDEQKIAKKRVSWNDWMVSISPNREAMSTASPHDQTRLSLERMWLEWPCLSFFVFIRGHSPVQIMIHWPAGHYDELNVEMKGVSSVQGSNMYCKVKDIGTG